MRHFGGGATLVADAVLSRHGRFPLQAASALATDPQGNPPGNFFLGKKLL